MLSLANTKSKTLLFAGFGLLLAALTALMALGLGRIESFNGQINALTEAQGRKIGTVSELFLGNGQRAALIDKLFAAEAAAARQAVHVEYRAAVGRYTRAVDKLRSLQVAPAARDEAVAAAGAALALGEKTVALLMQGEIAPASEINLTQAVLMDSRLQETLYLLLEASHAQNAQSIAAANQGMRNGFLLIGAGGVLALLAGIVIALLVIRIVASTENTLEREKELAEVTLHSIVDGVITTDAGGRIEYLNPVASSTSVGATRRRRASRSPRSTACSTNAAARRSSRCRSATLRRRESRSRSRCAWWTATGASARCAIRTRRSAAGTAPCTARSWCSTT